MSDTPDDDTDRTEPFSTRLFQRRTVLGGVGAFALGGGTFLSREQGSSETVLEDGSGSPSINPNNTQMPTASSLLYSTDTADAGQKILVAETADDIQPMIDAGASSGRDAIVQLLPKLYEPTSTIELRGEGSVVLQGCVPDDPRKWHGETEIAATNIPDGDAVVHFRGKYEAEDLGEPGTQADDCQLAKVLIDGDRKNGSNNHGVHVAFCGHPQVRSSLVTECAGNGLKFTGTQSAQCPTIFATNCGTKADDTHPIDLGGHIEADQNQFHRATVIGSVYAGTGPRGDSSPIKLRNGSTLRIKAASHRSGTRVQDSDVPGIHIVGGDLVAENITVTTNLHVDAPGILVDYEGGGSAHLRNSVIEKSDPNIRFDGGGGSFHNVEFYRGKARGDTADPESGAGFVAADTNRVGPFKLTNVSANNCEGSGFILPRGLDRVVHGIEAVGNAGDGIVTDGEIKATEAVVQDNGGQNIAGSGSVLTPTYTDM